MDIRYGQALPEEGGEGEDKINLVDLFSQLFLRSNGDVRQALEWLRRIAERQGWLNRERTFEDMLDELEEKGVLRRDKEGPTITPAGDQAVRESVFERVFKGMGRSLRGNHNTGRLGKGGERQAETRPFAFGDDLSDLDFTATLKNSFRRSDADPDDGPGENLSEEDFEVHEREQLASCSTVLMQIGRAHV